MQACTQCGKCCIKYSKAGLGSATINDLYRWLKFAPEIQEYAPWPLFDLWISPTTGEEFSRCPWLRKYPKRDRYSCRIHDYNPDCCREYPLDVDQMIRDGCEMLEPGDLDKPLHVLEAELAALRQSNHGVSDLYLFSGQPVPRRSK